MCVCVSACPMCSCMCACVCLSLLLLLLLPVHVCFNVVLVADFVRFDVYSCACVDYYACV